MNQISRIILVLSVMFTFASCSKSERLTTNNDINIMDIDKTGEEFARLLAQAMNTSKDLSSYLYNKAGERFDGDNNFLVIPALNEPVTKGGLTLKEMLGSSCIPTRSEETTNIDIDSIARKLKIESPLLQVFIMNEEAWNTTEDPLVVYIPDDFDDQIVSMVPAYNSKGNKIMLSSGGNYDYQSMIVVSRNERTVAVSKSVLGESDEYMGASPIHINENYNYYLKTDLEYTSIPTIEIGDIGDLFVPSEYKESYRYKLGNKGCDYVYKVRPKNKSAWNKLENPFLGDPELYVNVIYGKHLGGSIGADNVMKMFPTGYKNRNNIQWKVQDVEMIRWNLFENGKSMKYVWAEDDGGSIINIAVQYSIGFMNNQILNGTFNIGIGKKDERAGESIVYYTDENNHQYDTGYVLFTIQARV